MNMNQWLSTVYVIVLAVEAVSAEGVVKGDTTTRLEQVATRSADAQGSQKVSALLKTARDNDSRADGRVALAALDKLLEIDPAHAEALALRRKIAGYYGSVVYAVWPFDAREASSRQEKTAAAMGVEKHLTLACGKGVSMKLVLIPAGEFMMGSPADEEGRFSTEGPIHRVQIKKPFYIGVYEVTQEQYEGVIGRNPSLWKGARKPVNRVSWYEAGEFCKALSKRTGMAVRLPTEAEWEYACRAGTKTRFSYGDVDSSLYAYGNYCDTSNTDSIYTPEERKNDDGYDKTAPAGSYKPNAWGVYDMHGNLWEWCADWYREEYSVDPKAPPSHVGPFGWYRVSRGGCWANLPYRCRSASRVRGDPKHPSVMVGFRVVVVPGEKPSQGGKASGSSSENEAGAPSGSSIKE